MQDDNKKPTVEDQELADMIANLSGPASKAAPANSAPTPPPLTPPTPTSTPAVGDFSVPKTPPMPAPSSSLPPLPSSPVADPVSSLPPIPPAPPKSAPPKPDPIDDKPLPPIPPAPAPAKPTPLEDKPLPPLPPAPKPASKPLPPAPKAPADAPAGNLGSIKQNVLDELRPLVSKLDLPADEKFDTLLLLIRSTDDKALISQAYDAAKNIKDETRRAQALLDIVKEIDYFENPA